MSIPKFDAFATPALQFLSKMPHGASAARVCEMAAEWAKLSDQERAERTAGGQNVFKNRVGWTLTWLGHAGWVENPERGLWKITDSGLKRLKLPGKITAAELRPFTKAKGSGSKGSGQDEVMDPANLTPDDRIDAALKDLRAALAAELRQLLIAGTPADFEEIVLDMLEKMQYVRDYGRTERVGKSGDGGIDGIVLGDRLGLERIYVQAKRYEGSVPVAMVREFWGAMDAHRASRGVIVTTGTFPLSAYEFAKHASKPMRLVNGEELLELLMDFGVGVSVRRIGIPKLDRQYFDE